MLDFPALDVAIGLIFLYIILALVCSTVSEMVSGFVNLRARFLQQGIMNLLSGAKWPTDEGRAMTNTIYEHPLIQSLIRPGHGPEPEGTPQPEPGKLKKAWRRVRPLPSIDPTELTHWLRRPAPYPSYVPSRTFIAALTDLAERGKVRLEELEDNKLTDDEKELRKRIRKLPEGLERSLASIPNGPLSEALLAIYNSVEGDTVKFQRGAEQWFDDTMERVSGWYKRSAQKIVLVIAVLLVGLMNADTLTAARSLWEDDARRAAIVKKAEAAVGTGASDEIDVEEAVNDLEFPLGWDLDPGDKPTQIPNDLMAIAAKILGLLLTIGAVILGAPFWFDLLSKIMRVRSGGAPPPASDSIRSGEGEQRRAGPDTKAD